MVDENRRVGVSSIIDVNVTFLKESFNEISNRNEND